MYSEFYLSATVPAKNDSRVEYSLIEKGREIQPVMSALYHVGLQWLNQEGCTCPLEMSVASKPVRIQESVVRSQNVTIL